MRLFRQRPDKLETRLRDERPQPRDELVGRISSDARRSTPRRAPRLGLALAMSAVVVLAFSLTGGIGYAASAANNGTSALKNLVAQNDESGKGAAKEQGSANNNSAAASTAGKSDDSGSNGKVGDNQGEEIEES